MTARTAVSAGTPFDQLPALLTPGDVAALMCVDPKTVTRWTKTGKLPAAITTPGGHRRYSRASVLPYLTGGGE